MTWCEFSKSQWNLFAQADWDAFLSCGSVSYVLEALKMYYPLQALTTNLGIAADSTFAGLSATSIPAEPVTQVKEGIDTLKV